MTETNQLRISYEELDIADDYRHMYQGIPFTGIAYEEDSEGRLSSEDTFVDGILEGISRSYNFSGNLQAEEYFHHGALHGRCLSWYHNGQIETECVYEEGELVHERMWNHQGDLIRDQSY